MGQDARCERSIESCSEKRGRMYQIDIDYGATKDIQGIVA